MISKNIIDSVTTRLVKAYNPITVYLFGSYAWGKPDNQSDLDLLIVVDNSKLNPQARIHQGSDALWDFVIPKDILVYTKEEFVARENDPTSLCYKIKKEGKVLYARA